MNSTISYILSFFLLFLTATLPTNAMKSIQTPWYKCIRSKITPPNFVFPIVWTILYILIAIALAQVFQMSSSQNSTILIILFIINLILNVVWSIVYFGFKNSQMAYLILLTLIGITLSIMYYTYKILPLWVTYILMPYYLWLCFALLLSTVSLYTKCD